MDGWMDGWMDGIHSFNQFIYIAYQICAYTLPRSFYFSILYFYFVTHL